MKTPISIIAALLISFFVLAPSASIAQEQLLASYVADLGDEDRRNSSGKRLTTFAALIAQDRANYHRFGIRHEDDASDPIFSSRAMRAQISSDVMDVPDYYLPFVRNVLACTRYCGTYMVVQVYGSGNKISRIAIEVPG